MRERERVEIGSFARVQTVGVDGRSVLEAEIKGDLVERRRQKYRIFPQNGKLA